MISTGSGRRDRGNCWLEATDTHPLAARLRRGPPRLLPVLTPSCHRDGPRCSGPSLLLRGLCRLLLLLLEGPDLQQRLRPGDVGDRPPRPVQPVVAGRFPPAGRTQDLCRLLVERYDGRAENLWADVPDGATLLRRLGELPGFGAQKSKIFLALLGKQYGVTPPGWREAAGDYGLEGSRRSVADITGPQSLLEVRAFKQEQKQAAKAAKE